MGQQKNDFVVVFCTAPQGEAETLAKTLVEERLAACVNISLPCLSSRAIRLTWTGCLNRFSMMCAAKVSINIMNAFYGLE
jgi:uncharacterized protein involved in tolerance to divalent cations